MITQETSAFSGPLPPPGDLAAYENIAPGFADRIVTMAEKEQVQRHGNEHKLRDLQRRLLSRGQVFAFILSLAVVGGGFWLLLNDKPVAGFVTLLGAISMVAGPFLYQIRARRKQAEAAQQARR